MYTEVTTDRMSENAISASVHYVHLGGDNKTHFALLRLIVWRFTYCC